MQDVFSIRHYGSLGSTNDEARRLAAEGAPHGTVAHADEQTAGRGRRAHTWWSPRGNLYMSVILRTGLTGSRIAEISFIAALAVAGMVEAVAPQSIRPMLKWPNDVLVNDRKIAGVLLEQADDALILGIGVNVLEAPQDIGRAVTTLAAIGAIASVEGARDVLLDRLGHVLALWREQGFDRIRELWLRRSYPLGTAMRAVEGGETVAGGFVGLDADGALLLATPSGTRRIVAGSVTLA